MTGTVDRRRVFRSRWRTALAWTLESARHTAYVVVVFSLAGLASALGWLRWQDPALRWSFAVICWAVVVAVLVLARGAGTRRE